MRDAKAALRKLLPLRLIQHAAVRKPAVGLVPAHPSAHRTARSQSCCLRTHLDIQVGSHLTSVPHPDLPAWLFHVACVWKMLESVGAFRGH